MASDNTAGGEKGTNGSAWVSRLRERLRQNVSADFIQVFDSGLRSIQMRHSL